MNTLKLEIRSFLISSAEISDSNTDDFEEQQAQNQDILKICLERNCIRTRI